MTDASLVTTFFAAAIRVGTPLAFAAIGETLVERAGVINLGIEGEMLAGAFGAAVIASHAGVVAGVAGGALSGALIAVVFALLVVTARTDQIIAGTAVTLGAIGLTGLLAERVWGSSGAGLTLPTLRPVAVPLVSRIPLVGPAVFHQSPLTYLAMATVPATAWLLYRHRIGREFRACGESPGAAAAAGIAVSRRRFEAIIFGGICAGLGGATLVLADVGTFTERMTGGRGFIALAIVALGRWEPERVGAAALLFGGVTALQYLAEASGSAIPYQALQAAPYLLALAVLATAMKRGRGPAALGEVS